MYQMESSQAQSKTSNVYTIQISQQNKQFKHDLHKQRQLGHQKNQKIFKLKQRKRQQSHQIKILKQKLRDYDQCKQKLVMYKQANFLLRQQLKKYNQKDKNQMQCLIQENHRLLQELNSTQNQNAELKRLRIIKDGEISTLSKKNVLLNNNLQKVQQEIVNMRLDLADKNSKIEIYELKLMNFSIQTKHNMVNENYIQILNKYASENDNLKLRIKQIQRKNEEYMEQKKHLQQKVYELNQISNQISRIKQDYQKIYTLYQMKINQYQQLKNNIQNIIADSLAIQINKIKQSYDEIVKKKNSYIQKLVTLLSLKQPTISPLPDSHLQHPKN